MAGQGAAALEPVRVDVDLVVRLILYEAALGVALQQLRELRIQPAHGRDPRPGGELDGVLRAIEDHPFRERRSP